MDDFTITVKQEQVEYVDFPPIKEELHQLRVNPSFDSIEAEAIDCTADSQKVDDAAATKFECSICDMTFDQGQELTRHLLDHTTVEPYECDICSCRFKAKEMLYYHIRMHTGENLYACSICGAKFARNSLLKSHMLGHKGVKSFKCPQCSFSCSWKGNMIRHMKNHNGSGDHQCETCGCRFPTKKSLSAHARNHSKTESEYAVTAETEGKECDLKALTPTVGGENVTDVSLETHQSGSAGIQDAKRQLNLETSVNGGKETCEGNPDGDLVPKLDEGYIQHICVKPVVTGSANGDTLAEQGLLDMLNSESQQTLDTSSDRDVASADKMAGYALISAVAALHVKNLTNGNSDCTDNHTHTDEHKERILDCAKTYRNGAIVTGAESCKACEGVLHCETENSSADTQIAGSSGKKNKHVCNICSLTFNLAKQLRDHFIEHSGEKPYACDSCESKFNWERNLIAHKRIHTIERKSICGTWGMGFGRRSNLNHSGDKPFKCSQCPFSTSRQSYLTRHLAGNKNHKAKRDTSQTNTEAEEDPSRVGKGLDDFNAVIETGSKVARPQAIRISRFQSKGNILRVDKRDTVSFSDRGLSEAISSPDIQPDADDRDSRCAERIGEIETIYLPSDAGCIEAKANQGETLDPCDTRSIFEVCSAPVKLDFHQSKEALVEDTFVVDDPLSDTEFVDTDGSMADKDNTAALGGRMNPLERTHDAGTFDKAIPASKSKIEANQVDFVQGGWPEQNNFEAPVVECKESVDSTTSFQNCGSSLNRLKIEDGDLKTYECYECKCAFLAPSLLVTQLEAHTTEKIHRCPQCTEGDKVMDMKTPTGDKPYSCDFCEKTFSHKHHKANHMTTHTGEKPYSCDVCGKRFARANFKSNHMRIHTGDKPYSCGFCEKKFSLSTQKVTHMRTHTGEKPYCCDFCEKRFRQSCQKVQHMRSHTGEKPYSCDVCEKRFSQLAHRDNHMRTHTGEKPYSCDFCEKKFSQLAHRDIHMRTHTGEKPFSCDLCGQSFARNSQRSHHLKAHH